VLKKSIFEDQKLALERFLKAFKPSKNEEAAKKEGKNPSKNVKHSVSGGRCSWKN
jgi:hypothetical protein